MSYLWHFVGKCRRIHTDLRVLLRNEKAEWREILYSYKELWNTLDNYGFLKTYWIFGELWPKNWEKMHFNDSFIWKFRFSKTWIAWIQKSKIILCISKFCIRIQNVILPFSSQKYSEVRFVKLTLPYKSVVEMLS